MRLVNFSTALAVSALALTSCGLVLDGNGSSGSISESTSTQSAPASNESEEEGDDEPDEKVVPRLGDTWTSDSGLHVTISEPEEFTPSPTAAGVDGHDEHILMHVTITNETGSEYTPSQGFLTARSGDDEASPIVDLVNGPISRPRTDLLDGETVTYPAAFGVDDPDNLTVQYRFRIGDMSRESIIFVSP